MSAGKRQARKSKVRKPKVGDLVDVMADDGTPVGQARIVRQYMTRLGRRYDLAFVPSGRAVASRINIGRFVA